MQVGFSSITSFGHKVAIKSYFLLFLAFFGGFLSENDKEGLNKSKDDDKSKKEGDDLDKLGQYLNSRTLIVVIGLGFLGYLIFNTFEAAIIGGVIGFFVSIFWR